VLHAVVAGLSDNATRIQGTIWVIDPHMDGGMHLAVYVTLTI